MSAEYVRRYYGVDFKQGERLAVDHGYGLPIKHGVLVSFPGQYLGIRLDGEKHTSRIHPLEARRPTPTTAPESAEGSDHE